MILNLPWLQRHTKRFALFTVVQLLVQLLNAITGFVLVRGMGKEEYAWFTIANSLMATISVLADSGLSNAIFSLGGSFHHEPSRLANLTHAVKRLRFRFTLVAIAVTVPAGIWILHRNHAPIAVIIVLTFTTLLGALPATEGVVLTAVNRLQANLGHILRADTIASLTRLLAVLGGWVLHLTAILAALANTVAQWAQVLVLRRQTWETVHHPNPSDDNFNPAIMRVVRRMLPICIFTAVQGHLTVWILSVFATTSDVADLSALSRLAIVFGFIMLPAIHLISPAIARCPDPLRLTRLCIGTVAAYTVGVSTLVAVCMIFASQLLWILGNKYSHLDTELAWYLGSQAVGLLANVMWNITLVRGWFSHGGLYISSTIAIQMVGASFLDLQNVTAAIIFASIPNLIALVIAPALISRGLIQFARLSSAATES